MALPPKICLILHLFSQFSVRLAAVYVVGTARVAGSRAAVPSLTAGRFATPALEIDPL
jgi:hypothetical protein